MKIKKIISLLLTVFILVGIFPMSISAADNDKTKRIVYLHAQGENPTETTNVSTVYIGDTADVYFAVNDPNRGDYDKATDTHKEPQYDLNGYRIRICYDPDYFEFTGDEASPIDYTVPSSEIDTTDKEDEIVGDNTVENVPQDPGYFPYAPTGSGTYTVGTKTYNTAFVTVFFSGGYLPQKKDTQLWYNLAKLPLSPIKTGSTEVFIDLDSGDEEYTFELFAKNVSDKLEDQNFTYTAINGGRHNIVIKNRAKPAAPIATPSSGSYTEEVVVELMQEDNLPIYYTTDGSEPSVSSSPYDGNPITINLDTTIKACSYRESDKKYSNVMTYEYKILPDRPYLFDENGKLLSDINTISTSMKVFASDKDVYGDVTDGSTVYYTFSPDLDAAEENLGTESSDPNEYWVPLSKRISAQQINVDKNCVVRLVTNKTGKYSEPAVYYFSIRPLAPVANYDSGEYAQKIDITLSSDTKNAKIYYTIDGTDPAKRGIEYTGTPITLAKATTLRAVSYYDGVWSEVASYYYLFSTYDDFGVSAFYPEGVYEGAVNVTLTPDNPDYKVVYHTGDGKFVDYDKTITIDSDTIITAKAVKVDAEGNEVATGEEKTFTYNIKPLPPEFAPESTQFTNTNKIVVFTPESNADTTEKFKLYYTLDGSDPITSKTRILADDESDTAVIEIKGYTVVTAVVLKNGESYSNVVTHSYDIVTLKPVKPLTTLLPGHYTYEIGGKSYGTQFMPVPQGTRIYYTVSYNGELCPDPIPNTSTTKEYDGSLFIDIKGNTVIKAVSVNVFGVKSDVGIYAYTVKPETPVAAPSAAISGNKLPVVPVDAVKGSTVKYTIGNFSNKFENTDAERFYIDTETGMAYRDKECTARLGDSSTNENSGSVTLEIFAVLDGVESDVNRYTYSASGSDIVAPPYADKQTGTYEEKKIDADNNLLKVMLYSLNNGGKIQYRLDNQGDWKDYTDDSGLLLKPAEKTQDTIILQIRCEKDGEYSSVVSYVYSFVPLAPVIALPSGTYLESDKIYTKIAYNEDIPTDKAYNIFYRRNGDKEDRKYNFSEIEPESLGIDHTMTIKAYVLNEDTRRVSKSAIHYYIIENGNEENGSVYIAHPYDVERISAHLLGEADYAEGIKLLSWNNAADIYYRYSYIRKSDGQKIETKDVAYDVNRPIIPTTLMDDITIVAWLEDENGKIAGSEKTFNIDFVHMGTPATSLEASGEVEHSSGTKYTLINDYPQDENITLYYTLDGSDPADANNEKRIAYKGEELTLTGATTVKTVYYSACGKCYSCKEGNTAGCWYGAYGETATYKYTIPTTISTGGGGGGGGGSSSSKKDTNTRKYTSDVFGNEHPTHIGYINGYPDGSVKPEGNITREEITAILYRITNHEYEAPFITKGNVFTDVEYSRWSALNVEYMADKGVVNGYPDGEFKPTKSLTRAEFATLIFRFAGIKKANIANPFTDLESSHWAYSSILALVNSGLMEGYPDNTYRPENNITRAEVMTVVNKILGRNPLESYIESLKFNPYNDLSANRWYYEAVLEATITHNYWLDDKGYEYKWEDWK